LRIERCCSFDLNHPARNLLHYVHAAPCGTSSSLDRALPGRVQTTRFRGHPRHEPRCRTSRQEH
jgi:hypothetical protein